MKLLDAATVIHGDGNWMLGWEAEDRTCIVDVRLVDACDPSGGGAVVDGADTNTVYKVVPFVVEAQMTRSVLCERDDDASWLSQALRDIDEQALGRALVIEPVAGSQTWVGADGVTEVPAPDTADELASATAAARRAWFDHNIGVPIMHVAPEGVPALVAAGILISVPDGELVSVWGDPVASSPGYTPTPPVFFTGPVTVYLGSASADMYRATRMNNVVNLGLQPAAVDVSPCSIVRLGPLEGSSFRLSTTYVSAGTPGAFTFTTENSSGSVTYDWGDGTTTTTVPDGTTPSHTYANNGVYTVSVTDSTGAADSVIVDYLISPPTLTTLNPATAAMSDPDLVMTVTGTGFSSTSVIVWNGVEQSTTYISGTQLSTTVKPSRASAAGTVPVTVRNRDGQSSGAKNFTITAAVPLTIVQTSAPALAVTITWSGLGTGDTTTVNWGDATAPVSRPAGAGTASHTYASVGAYTVTVTPASHPAATLPVNTGV
ncbi:MAG: PKD domain-containing protein [Dermatophilaceae bacterium]